MASITTRSAKGSELTHQELDDNFTNLNTDKLEQLSDDTTPQLGGDLDVQNFGLIDSNGNEMLEFSSNAGATEYLTISNGTDSSSNIYNAAHLDSTGDVCVQMGSINNTFYVDGQIGIHGDSYIVDSSRHEILHLWSAGNPVNYLRFDNSETTYNPSIKAAGDDTNIGLSIVPKGTGSINLDGPVEANSLTVGTAVYPTAAGTSGQVPMSNGANNLSMTTLTESHISDLGTYLETVTASDIDATAITDGYVLTADGVGGAAWEAVAGGDLINDTTPQLGGNLDVNGNKIVSTTNGDIDIEPNGTGNVLLGNFEFDADQTVGAGQDNYVLTYDNATGLISLEASTAGTSLNALSDTDITAAAKGDILVHNGTDWVDLTVGTNDQILTADSAETTGVKWATVGTGGLGNV